MDKQSGRYFGLRTPSSRLVSGGSVAAISALALVCASAGPASADPPVLNVRVGAATVPMQNMINSATNAVATCPAGTKLVGGGIRVGRAGNDPTTPNNGLKVNGTYPSNSSGTPVADGSRNPGFWTAAGGFGGQSEAGDEVTSFAMCATSGSAIIRVAVASVNAPTVAAPTATVTATCPPGTKLVGGGALATPPESGSLKPVGSYPSDSSGNMVADGATNPQSWTVVSTLGANPNNPPPPDSTTTAFAVCSTPPSLQTVVERADTAGPTVASQSVTASATCTGTTQLLSGGVNVTNSNGDPIQQGLHLRGSYPSDASGTPVTDGALNPATWSGIVQAGGQPTPNTETHVFAICRTAGPPA